MLLCVLQMLISIITSLSISHTGHANDIFMPNQTGLVEPCPSLVAITSVVTRRHLRQFPAKLDKCETINLGPREISHETFQLSWRVLKSCQTKVDYLEVVVKFSEQFLLAFNVLKLCFRSCIFHPISTDPDARTLKLWNKGVKMPESRRGSMVVWPVVAL